MRFGRLTLLILSVAATSGLPEEVARGAAPQFGRAEISLADKPAPPASYSVCGFSVIAEGDGPQLALTKPESALIAGLRRGEQVDVRLPIRAAAGPLRVVALATHLQGSDVEVNLSLDRADGDRAVLQDGQVQLEASRRDGPEDVVVRLRTIARSGDAAVRLSDIRVAIGGRWHDVPIRVERSDPNRCPPPVLPPLLPAIERALVEWDWRMQDGIRTERAPSTYAAAVERTLRRGEELIRDLQADGVPLQDEAARWGALWRHWRDLSAAEDAPQPAWEDLWRRVHLLRRQIALSNPLARVGPLVFVKRVPSAFSHQLTQYYGRDARPGGGVFVLDAPGKSMRCRQLAAGVLPEGSYEHLDVSHRGDRVLFSFCHVETAPENRDAHPDCFYHIYEMNADGSNVRQLITGAFDDFAPRYLPDGRILFISTRRRGFHRCGRGPCPVYTLAVMNADGSDPRPVSYHETHEWDPAVLHDGRIIYTRWDYVDRHAVHYQQLWTVRPDGSDVRIFYGNNTFNPVGVWEARPVPGSGKVMATAAAHHAMSAGSIILLDTARGIDGLGPIARLTPDAPFPESETRVPPVAWHAPVGVTQPRPTPPEAVRWPGHCYRTPYPLSEKYFLAAYSFDSLIGEPKANPANMFGVYLVDRSGNKELLYRDLNISSLWPTPLGPRRRPPGVPCVAEPTDGQEGTFFLQNVYESWPPVPKGTVKRLRVVQVLPKSTPHINDPPVGLPNASPGKQVLGTVPVEPDGSACFCAPAGIPLAFQALDERGQAVQMMRSLTYLQPGERASCVGCHEPRTAAPPRTRIAQALARPPSTIAPGPDGSNPLSYPILVQPVLDKHCVRCHNRDKPDGGVVLTGEPQGRYTVSYNALAPLVPYSAWGGRGGDFRRVNSEPLTMPGHFGARGSRLMKLLREGHYQATLGADEFERLATWMDANALFYGTFDPADQARQKRGQRIEGPKLQ